MSADGSQRAPVTGGDDLFAVGVIAMGTASFAVWVGAQLASLTGSGRFLAASPADGLGALIRLPAHGRDPAAAWPPGARSTLPGPILYWTATTITLVVLVGAAVWLWLRLAPTIGTRQRRRLGVTVGARLATPRDLAPLIVRARPQAGSSSVRSAASSSPPRPAARLSPLGGTETSGRGAGRRWRSSARRSRARPRRWWRGSWTGTARRSCRR